MYTVYILKSMVRDRFYICHTADLDKRLKEHNAGRTKSTKAYVPWKVIYTENYETKSQAVRREFEIKSYKSGIKFYSLVS
ncbi:MAG: GIY-YIG nuclease family protein [Bacteroidetes bacterium]|nr:GIY-YIG nuclease family protein [Bacteroidota bacterium]